MGEAVLVQAASTRRESKLQRASRRTANLHLDRELLCLGQRSATYSQVSFLSAGGFFAFSLEQRIVV